MPNSAPEWRPHYLPWANPCSGRLTDKPISRPTTRRSTAPAQPSDPRSTRPAIRDTMSKEPLLEAYGELAAQNIALRCMISILFGEIALLARDPHAKLDHMMTSLSGMTEKLALVARAEVGDGDKASLIITKTVENVRTMAEAVF